MQSFAAFQAVRDRIGKPVISAAAATTYRLLTELNQRPVVPNADTLPGGDR
jgi:maleate isomerase